MNQIEAGEIEEILCVCAWVRRLVASIQPALTALVERVGEIEKQCRVWEFRARHAEGEENED